MWKLDWYVKSCLSEHTLKTKWTHFKSHKIKVIAIVYWESVKLTIFSPEWLFHARWLSLDTLPNMLYPIFHVWLSTSEKRNVNRNSNLINPKRAGLFCLSQVRGGEGGADSAPPSDLGRGAMKILKFGTYVEFINTHVLTKLQCWKSNRFLIMQIYVNYMHVLLFFIITDKMRPFRAFKMFWYCHRNI